MTKYDWHELEDLLALVAGQDVAAFEELYNRTCPRLFGICVRILRDTFAAQDVLQEVFVSVWKQAKSFDRAKESALAWMISAARGSAVERLRSGSSRSAMLEKFDLDDNAEAVDDEAELLASYPRSLRFGMKQLQADDAALLCTAYFEGANYAELAAITELPISTIKERVRGAFATLLVSMA